MANIHPAKGGVPALYDKTEAQRANIPLRNHFVFPQDKRVEIRSFLATILSAQSDHTV